MQRSCWNRLLHRAQALHGPSTLPLCELRCAWWLFMPGRWFRGIFSRYDWLCQISELFRWLLLQYIGKLVRVMNVLDNKLSPQCPNNFLYDAEKQWCSYPHEKECDERPCLYPDRCGTQPHTTSTTQASSTDPASSTSTTPATTTEDCGHKEFCQDHLSMGL